MILSFTVYGIAQSKGSMQARHIRSLNRSIVTDSNRGLASWQQLVREGANRAIGNLPDGERGILRGPVRLTIGFYLPRPKQLQRPKHAAAAHVCAPDWDKLARAVGDALTGVAYHDDAQVVEGIVGKFYTGIHEPPHVNVRVEPTAGASPSLVRPAPGSLFDTLEPWPSHQMAR